MVMETTSKSVAQIVVQFSAEPARIMPDCPNQHLCNQNYPVRAGGKWSGMARMARVPSGGFATDLYRIFRATARCIAALAVGTALFSVSAASRQEHTTNSRVQKGRAAFYSSALEGHKTACGGRYVASELTTAHRSLPCGTRVRITNTKNDKSVEATVNDWGPTSRNRIVDVSRAVAEKLDFVKQGTATVKIEVVQ